MKISYDYDELIQEIKEDIIEHKVLNYKDYIWIVRADEPVHKSYRPIIDWYYFEDLKSMSLEEQDKLKAVKVQVGVVLIEMIEANDIFKGV
ncbi:hypothetical protein [Vagococcus carniphilus]|uniref:hypothetical protein n=1 Tax=Vagococcus carniphilus TaxID=218144 RepID=UPI003BAC0DD4